jgi:Fe-S oxidoreductase
MSITKAGEKTHNRLSVLLMEPDTLLKRRHLAEILTRGGAEDRLRPEQMWQRLGEIRDYTLSHLDELCSRFLASLKTYPETTMVVAASAQEALEAVRGVSKCSRIAVNQSALVLRELVPLLKSAGFSVLQSYYDECRTSECYFSEYRETSMLEPDMSLSSFRSSSDLVEVRQSSIQKHGIKDFVGLLGVNAVSADGAVVLLQHTENIRKIFEHAREVILVIGLDKVVRNLEDAIFQTKCSAVLGYRAMAAEIARPVEAQEKADSLPFETGLVETSGKIHMILLDNGRRELLHSQYKSLLACISCRACNYYCPAYTSGKTLAPAQFLPDLKKSLLDIDLRWLHNEEAQFGTGPSTEENPNHDLIQEKVWDCTTCGVCEEVCPLEIPLTLPILHLRQSMVMEHAQMPSHVTTVLKSIEDRGHPWRGTTFTRSDWARELGIPNVEECKNSDFLYWVGCTSALEASATRVAYAMGRLFELAGLKVAILGPQETCCGEPARRLGNEYLFRQLAIKNIHLIKAYGIKRIVTNCPHCYHTLKNEYRELGGDFEVMHSVQLLDELLSRGKLRLRNAEYRQVTYQDPCYLGRYNGIYELPRQLLRRLPNVKLVEMEPNREKSFCCGGGGGRIWQPEPVSMRASNLRLEHAVKAGADLVAVSCPFCLLTLEAAAQDMPAEPIAVMDIIELLAEAILGKAIKPSHE